MKKNTYFIIQIEENGKFAAYAHTINNSNNLVPVFADIKNIYSVNIADSKKEAEEIARHWNKCYRNNGTYLYA